MKKTMLFAGAVAMGVASAAPVQRNFAWDATTFDAACSGHTYKLYSGGSSGSYQNNVQVGNVLTGTLTLDSSVDNYVAATALQTCNGTVQESGFSNEVMIAGERVVNPVTNPRLVMVAAPPVPVNFSMWSLTTTPAASETDSAVTLGVQFKVSETGHQLVSVRYFKHAQSTTPSVVGVWNSSGNLLTSVTATNETSSGWQTVTLATPIDLVANQIYTMGYKSNGGYFYESGFAWPVVNGVLSYTAGLYTYGSSLARPTSVWNDTNYWIDGVFK